MNTYDLVIVGGGPAGLAAAASAKDHGTRRTETCLTASHAGSGAASILAFPVSSGRTACVLSSLSQ